MALDNPDTVDILAENAARDTVTAFIVTTEPWDEAGAQCMRLHDKLKNVVTYLADGQFVQDYPDLQGKRRCVEIRSKYPLQALEQRLIDTARELWCSPDEIELIVTIVADLDQPRD